MPRLQVLPGEVWLHRFERPEDLSWLVGSRWCSVTTTEHELSVACERQDVPGALGSSGPYRVLRVRDLSDHGALGIVAGVSRPLAEAGISIFTVSSWDTCDTLVPAGRLDEAVDALVLAGYEAEPIGEAVARAARRRSRQERGDRLDLEPATPAYPRDSYECDDA